MLTLGERTFLEKSGWNHSIMECYYHQAARKVRPCKNNLAEMAQRAKVALWHAGGNWGDIWLRAMAPRIHSFLELLLLGFTIVGMPQSLYYKDQELKMRQKKLIGKKVMAGLNLTELESAESLALTRSRLIFTWREKESYLQGKTLYPFATNRLVPDIAFQLGPFQPIRPKLYADLVDIVLLLRGDKESHVAEFRNRQAIQTMLNSIPNGGNLTFVIVDWNDRLKIFGTNVTLFDQTSVKLLSMGKVVICDRLHAAILSYISGLPFVYLDQVSNKLTKTLGVALSSDECKDEDGSMLTKATSLKDALEKAADFIDKYQLYQNWEVDTTKGLILRQWLTGKGCWLCCPRCFRRQSIPMAICFERDEAKQHQCPHPR